MINYVIVEDNIRHRKILKDIIIKYMMKNKIEFDIKEFSDDSKSLRDLIEGREINHIYILDFELPSTTAIDISRIIRKTDWTSPIIVFTVNGGMAYETFKQRLQILDFVNKQFEASKNLEELFNICIEQFNLKRALTFKYKSVDYNIELDKIIYIYRDTIERKSVIVTNENEYKVNTSIVKLYKMLNKDFVFTHKACVVNKKRVEEIIWKENKIVFDNGKVTYLLSKTHKKELKEHVLS